MFGCLRLVRRAIVLTTMIVLVVTTWAAGIVLVYAHRHDTTRTDAIVVLGAAQYAGTPTPLLANRLGHARIVYRAGIAPHIVTVGGKRPGDLMTEADAGRRYLIRRGVPDAAVIAVPDGRNTWTSLRAVRTLFTKRGWHSITIVSDPTHVGRAATMARRLGMPASVSPTVGGSGSSITAAQVARETAGLMWFWAQRWLPNSLSRWQG